VAGAQQMVRLLIPEVDRTTDVGADLGIRQDATNLPVLTGFRNLDGVKIHPDDENGSLGLCALELNSLKLLEVLGLSVDELADL